MLDDDTALNRERLRLPPLGESAWAGMGNYELSTPEGNHVVRLVYRGEPPHGDSYHDVSVDGKRLPGYAWGCQFACTENGRYLAFSWMAKRFERSTIVVDMTEQKYFVLPIYIGDFVFRWPGLEGVGQASAARSFAFSGSEQWTDY